MNGKKFALVALAITALTALFCPQGRAARKTEKANEGDWLRLAERYPLTASSANGERLSASILARWWDALDDELLPELIGRALKHNKDLDAALARVYEARAALGIAGAGLSPAVSLGGKIHKSRISDNAGGTGELSGHRLGFDASWEIDLFGRLRRGASARRADLEAEVAGLQNVWVSVAAEVALNYANYRSLQARLDVMERNVLRQEDMLRFVA